jgi:hypothetical protein
MSFGSWPLLVMSSESPVHSPPRRTGGWSVALTTARLDKNRSSRIRDIRIPAWYDAKLAISWVLNGLGRDRQRQQDSERLLQILTMDPEVLCLTQRART